MVLSHQHFDLFGKIVLERVVFKPPFAYQNDMQNEACLFYNIRGNTDIYSALDRERLSENECAILKCGKYFTNHTSYDSKVPSDVIGVHFYPDVIKAVFENHIPSYLLNSPMNGKEQEINRVVVDAILENYIQSLLLLFENPKLVTDELIATKVKEVLLMLINTDSKEAEKIRAIISDIFNPTQATFKEIVAAHYYDTLTTAQLAYLCNMSLSTFKRRFLETFRENPATYMRKKKLERAAELLKSSKESIASICYDVGFSNTSNFVKIFSSHFNCTPSAYRKSDLLK